MRCVDQLPGTSIGPSWEVVRPLGRGAMGRVFLCSDRLLPGRVAAVKLLWHAPRDPDVARQFAAEVESLERLAHPGIVSARGAGVDPQTGRFYLAMEYVEGCSLSQRLLEGPFDLVQAAQVFSVLFDALYHAHLRGIAHRDVKPSNIVLGKHGPRLVDFGIAVATGASGEGPGPLRGTPAYMAPEVLAGDGGDPAAADLHAMGLVLFEALTGRRPFECSAGSDVDAVAAVLAEKRSSPPKDPGPDWPDPLRALVRGLTTADPRDRLLDRAGVAHLLADTRARARRVAELAEDADPTLAPPVPGVRRARARHDVLPAPLRRARPSHDIHDLPPPPAVVPDSRSPLPSRPSRGLVLLLAGSAVAVAAAWAWHLRSEIGGPELRVEAADPITSPASSPLGPEPRLEQSVVAAPEAGTRAPALGAVARPRELVEAARGALLVGATPVGAAVRVDGADMGAAPLQVSLEEGEHIVVVTAPGHVAQRRIVTVGNERAHLVVELLPERRPAQPVTAPRQGEVLVSLPGWRGAELLVDGRSRGTLPARTELIEGPHTFAVRGPLGELVQERDVVLEGKGLTRVRLNR